MNIFDIISENYYDMIIIILTVIIFLERYRHKRILKKEIETREDIIHKLNSCNTILKDTNRLLRDRLDRARKVMDQYNKQAMTHEDDIRKKINKDLYDKYQTGINLAIHALLGTRTKAGKEALQILREIAGKTQ